MMSKPVDEHVDRVTARRDGRAGFTLLEMLLAVSIMLVVFGLAVPFFRTQLGAMAEHAGRFDAEQNARFGAATLDRQLRTAGAGVPAQQPMIVQADPFAITFNADLAARDTASEGGAFGAVYYDPDLPVGSTMSLTPSAAITLPLSTRIYPSTTYDRAPGLLSTAETISFWVAPDSTPGSAGRFALYRRVNNMPPAIVARGLLIRPGDPPPFTYYIIDTNTGAPVAIPAARLPVFHDPLHGSPADTGSSALTDSIRTVHVFFRGTFVGAKHDTTFRVVESDVRMMNAGLLKLPTCGDPPVFGQSVSATYGATPQPHVTVAWSRATDEGGGEKDVERYTIWRRPVTGTFGEPLASVPAGQTSYQFDDTQGIASGQQWVYGVAAEDCGGQFSPVVTTNTVTIP